MNKSILVFLLCAGGTLLPWFQPVAHASDWYDNWRSATAASRRSGQPLIVMFAHEGCPECAKMNSAMANSRAEAALQNAVKARLEFSEEPTLTSQFGVSVTPTLLIFNPASGFDNYVYREEGALSVNGIVSLGRRVDSIGGQSRKGDEKTVASADAPNTASDHTASPATRSASQDSAKTSVKKTHSSKRSSRKRSSVTHSSQSSYNENPSWYNPWGGYYPQYSNSGSY